MSVKTDKTPLRSDDHLGNRKFDNDNELYMTGFATLPWNFSSYKS